jgi:hypothetical protein
MTLDEIRAAKIEMEEVIFKSVSAAQKRFEESTKLNVSSVRMNFAYFDCIGGGQKTILERVKCEVNPWQ